MNAETKLETALTAILQALGFHRLPHSPPGSFQWHHPAVQCSSCDPLGTTCHLATPQVLAIPTRLRAPLDDRREVVLRLSACERCHALATAGHCKAGDKCSFTAAHIVFTDGVGSLGSWSSSYVSTGEASPIERGLAQSSLSAVHDVHLGELGTTLSDAWEAAQRLQLGRMAGKAHVGERNSSSVGAANHRTGAHTSLAFETHVGRMDACNAANAGKPMWERWDCALGGGDFGHP